MDREQPHRDRATGNMIVRGWINYYGHFYPSSVGRVTQEHRQIFGALGDAKVQTTEAQPQAGMGAPESRGNTRTRALRSLASHTTRPDGGSRMTGGVTYGSARAWGCNAPGHSPGPSRRRGCRPDDSPRKGRRDERQSRLRSARDRAQTPG